MKTINIITTILGIIAVLASIYVIFEQRNIDLITLIFFVIGVVLVGWKNKGMLDQVVKIIEKLK